jgi:hypothetical protein
MIAKSKEIRGESRRDAMLKPLIEDLLKLEAGVQVGNGIVKAGVVAYLGDNQESHAVAGMSICFSSYDVCRICHQQHADLQETCSTPESQPSQPWTREEYDEACAELEKDRESNPDRHIEHGKYGIRVRCALNALESFHCIGQFPLDFLHDWLEKVGAMDGYSVIVGLIKSQKFTLDEYNYKLECLKLQSYEGSDRPQKMKPLKPNTRKLEDKGMATALHIRLLPYILFRLGAEKWLKDEDVRHLLLLMVKIVRINEYMLADKLSITDVNEFEDLMDEYVEIREICDGKFPRIFQHKTPKDHFITHYAEQMKQWGPMSTVGTARAESKHQMFKKFANTTKNMTNIPKTLAVKHQKLISTKIHKNSFNIGSAYDFPGKTSGVQAEDLEKFQGLLQDGDMLATKAVVWGTTYAIGLLVVTSSSSSEMLCVGEILQIVLRGTSLLFIIEQREAIRQDLGYFQAAPEAEVTIVNYTKLWDFKPLIKRDSGKCFRFVLHHHLLAGNFADD